MRSGIVPSPGAAEDIELLACRNLGKHTKSEASGRKNKENSSETNLEFHDRKKAGHVGHSSKVMIRLLRSAAYHGEHGMSKHKYINMRGPPNAAKSHLPADWNRKDVATATCRKGRPTLPRDKLSFRQHVASRGKSTPA